MPSSISLIKSSLKEQKFSTGTSLSAEMQFRVQKFGFNEGKKTLIASVFQTNFLLILFSCFPEFSFYNAIRYWTQRNYPQRRFERAEAGSTGSNCSYESDWSSGRVSSGSCCSVFVVILCKSSSKAILLLRFSAKTFLH